MNMKLIVNIALWDALVAGFLSNDFKGLQISFFSLVVLYIWDIVENIRAENEFKQRIVRIVDYIITQNTGFSLKNIEYFLFGSHETVIQEFNESINDSKDEFRKDNLRDFRDIYIFYSNNVRGIFSCSTKL